MYDAVHWALALLSDDPKTEHVYSIRDIPDRNWRFRMPLFLRRLLGW